MGCDIHAVVQRRVNGAWEVVTPPAEMLDRYGDAPWESRNYTRFGVFAGVRDGAVEAIVEPRGLPEDDSVTVVHDDTQWGLPYEANIDGHDLGDHSYSWLSVADFIGHEALSDPYEGGEWTIGEVIGADVWLPWLISLGEPNDVRLVFGFDS